MADVRSKRKRQDEALDSDGKKHRSSTANKEDETKDRRRNDHGRADDQHERSRKEERKDVDGRRRPSSKEDIVDADGARHRRGHHDRHKTEGEAAVARAKEEDLKDDPRGERKEGRNPKRTEKDKHANSERERQDRGRERAREAEDGDKNPKRTEKHANLEREREHRGREKGREVEDEDKKPKRTDKLFNSEREGEDRGRDKAREAEEGDHKRPKEESEEVQPKRRRWDAEASSTLPVETVGEKVEEKEKSGNGQLKVTVKTEVATPEMEYLPLSASRPGDMQALPSASVKLQIASGETMAAGAPKAQLSLDALAKAKRALQMQKELNEKLKKLPQLGKQPIPGAPPPPVAPTAAAIRPSVVSAPTPAIPGLIPGMLPSVPIQGGLGFFPGLPPGTAPNLEAIQRAQEMAARLGFQPAPGAASQILGGGVMAEDLTTLAPKPPMGKPPVLRLDAQGREVDEMGNVVERAKAPVSTLKVNLNKQKREAFKILHPELEDDPEDNPFFDPRMSIDKKKLVRPRRATFTFVEEGKLTRMAEGQRLRAKFGEERAAQLKARQAAFAKAKAESEVNPNLVEVGERVKEEKKPKDPIPEVEWWDARLLLNSSYEDVDGDKFDIKADMLTIYVEHPVLVEPPAEAPPPPPQPLKLTKKEQKKLKTQQRVAREKERQEMVRQGLLEPQKQKIKMSNLMKVLGTEAVQDPTKLEREVRDAAAEREQAHVDRNLARKLTPAEKSEKKERKLFDDPDTTLETIVAVYRVNDLSNPQLRFKVDMNAQQNRLTGCLVMSDTMSLVVVEGGTKSIKRYSKLMLRRIDWNKGAEGRDEDEDGPRKQNKCLLVWQGSVARPNFDRFTLQQCRTDVACWKFLSDAGVGHYWDVAVNFPED